MRLQGIIPPLTTPFEDGKVSAAMLRDNIARYEAIGVGGYLLLGSSGEAALLEEDEKIAVLRAAREAIPENRPMIAGVGMESTAATIRMAEIGAGCGADLLLVLTPHYFGPQMDGAALIAHYRAVADHAPVPVLLYNVPKFTHVQIELDAVPELAGHENIAGIKDSAGDVQRMIAYGPVSGPGFEIVCGNHGILLDALGSGVRSAILAAADPFPEVYVAIQRLHGEGRRDEATRLHDEIRAVSNAAVNEHGVPGIKTAMDLRGFHGGPPRPPLLPLGGDARDELRREIARLAALGVLTETEHVG